MKRVDADNHWIGNYQVTEHHLNSGSWDWWFCLIFLYLWYILQFLWLIGNVVSIVFNLSHFIMSSKYQTTDTIIKVLHNSWDLRLNIFLSLKRQNYTIFSTYWHKHSFFQKTCVPNLWTPNGAGWMSPETPFFIFFTIKTEYFKRRNV